MAVTTINLEPQAQRTARAHRVYLRAKWSEEWEEIPFLYAEEVAWRLAPSISTANLIWRYGQGMRPGEAALKVIERLSDKRRLWCKIEIDTHAVTEEEREEEEDGTPPQPLKWYGSIELDGFANEGLIQTGVKQGSGSSTTPIYKPCGTQPLVALGLEYALYQRPIRGATWLDSSGKEQRSERPIVFNRPNAAGQPDGNRSATKGTRSFVFSSTLGMDAAKTWNSRKIVEYLCAQEVPTGPGGSEQWMLLLDPDTEEVVPDWDFPVIDPTGMSMGEMLNVLLPRSRMLSWQITVYGSGEAVFLTPVSLLGSDVTTDLGRFKKNHRQINLQTSMTAYRSPDVTYAIKDSDIGRIDQARVRGARRTSTCTLAYADDSLDTGWPVDLELEYEAGFSGAATYAGLHTDGKQAANAEVRATDRLFPVFRRFAIPDEWDQKVKDGLGGGIAKPVFLLTDDSSDGVRKICPREIALAPMLPLTEGFDYERVLSVSEAAYGTTTAREVVEKLHEGPHGRVAALVLFKTPDWLGAGDPPYIQVDKIGTGSAIEQVSREAGRNWSARVEVANDDRAVLLHVSGEPQHVVEGENFSELPVDPFLGNWDWRDALFTVCLLDDRHAEGVYPDDSAADDNVVGMRRELVIQAGDAYKMDYIVEGTVIGVNPETRQPVRCIAGGWINNDKKTLVARARQVYEYYGTTRRSLVLSTPLINSQVRLGDYVVDFGNVIAVKSLGTVVSEIVVTIPEGENNPPPPSIQYTTAFAELDTLELLNQRPAVVEPTGRKGALAEARA
jgi:hypothetical protein